MRIFRILQVLMLVTLVCNAHVTSANNTTETNLRLLVLGDSLAAGYGLAANEAFPVVLEHALRRAGHHVTVINAGISGDTTAGGLARLSWALADNPHLVIVELGGNDALRGLPPKETEANLDAILGRLSNAGLRVILTGMRAPRNMGEQYASEFDKIFPRLARKYKTPFYPFFLDGVALNPNLNQPDGIHPNASGVIEIVSRILPVVESVIRSIQE
jgi:acyl-CoA thioesterase-1